MITNHSIVVATQKNHSEELDGETVILNSKLGVYYGLNQVGTTIWNQLQQPRKVNEIRDAILVKYKVESEQCDGDLFALLKELEAEGLIEVCDEATA